MNKYCDNCKHLYNCTLDECSYCGLGNYGFGNSNLFARQRDTVDYYDEGKKRWTSQW